MIIHIWQQIWSEITLNSSIFQSGNFLQIGHTVIQCHVSQKNELLSVTVIFTLKAVWIYLQHISLIWIKIEYFL